MKMYLEIGNARTQSACYLSEKGLKEGARKELEGKTFLDVFPAANEPKSFWGIILHGIDASTVPIIVISADEYDKRFPDDNDSDGGEEV